MTVLRGAKSLEGAEVNADGRLFTLSVTESEAQHSTEIGEAYNVNTKKVALTANTASAVYYYKHNETLPLVINSMILYVSSDATTTTNDWEADIIANPTAGTIVSNAVAASITHNRNFSEKSALDDSLKYKGVEGDTFTDGDDYIFVMGTHGQRVPVTIDTILKKGDSIGVKLNTYTTAGTTNVYVAMVCHLKEAT